MARGGGQGCDWETVRAGKGRAGSGPKAQMALSAETQMWICKPTASNQGKGIFLLRNQEEVTTLQAKTQSIEDDPIYRKMPFRSRRGSCRGFVYGPMRGADWVGLTQAHWCSGGPVGVTGPTEEFFKVEGSVPQAGLLCS